MPRFIKCLLYVAIAATIPALARSQKGVVTPAGPQCLLVSDIHLDPMEGGVQPDKLLNADLSEWDALLAAAPVSDSHKARDCNYALLMSALENMRRVCPRPKVIVMTGDLVWHDDFDPKGYDEKKLAALKIKTCRFVFKKFRDFFPVALFAPALGNNDAFSDYQLQDATFLRGYRHGESPFNSSAIHLSPACAGSYRLAMTGGSSTQLIVLNTAPLSAKSNDPAADGLAKATLHWLDTTLAAVRPGHHVWLCMHIPPGPDVFKSISRDSIVPAWRNASSGTFAEILHKHAGTVTAIFAGHTHMDEFRLVRYEGQPEAWIKVIPAITTIYSNNPAFCVGQYDPHSGKIKKIRDYELDTSIAKSKEVRQSRWREKYDTYTALGSTPVTTQLLTDFLTDEQHRDILLNWFDGHPADSNVWRDRSHRDKYYQWAGWVHPGPR